MATYYDVARMANTMGIQTTIVLKPEQITVRVKNSIKRQLRNGHITGSDRSHAAKIAKYLAEKYELPVLQDGWRGFSVGSINMETKAAIREFFEADWAAELLEQPGMKDGYYRTRYEEGLSDLGNPLAKNFHLLFHDKTLKEKASAFIGQQMDSKDRERIEKVVDLLDGTEEIHITTIQ